MSAEIRALPSPGIKQVARSYPHLDDQASREAWVACCTRRFPGTARYVSGGDAVAGEVLQESWTRAITHACEYRGDSPACSWVGMIVANCAKDFRARENRARTVRPVVAASANPATDPEAYAQEWELLALLHAVVDELPQKSREVYAMRYGEGLSPAETASRLGISEPAVGTRLNRAVGLVKQHLAARMRPRV